MGLAVIILRKGHAHGRAHRNGFITTHLMTNPYFIQLIGILLTAAGVVALTAASRIFGRPLKYEEKRETGKEGNWYRLPFNLETIASGALFLAGIGILKWSNFSLCAFLAYWLPDLPEAIRLLFSCR